jgi:hypothetical protein
VEGDVSSSWAELISRLGASTVTLAALMLALMALAHLSLRWWMKRKARRDGYQYAGEQVRETRTMLPIGSMM